MFDVVSFTGTQEGMTKEQQASFQNLFLELNPKVLINGDCIGSDFEASTFAKMLNEECIVVLRPCNTKNKRAFFKNGVIVSEPKPPLERNHDIVDDGQCLIATPKNMVEELRSGTWATIRYARKQNKAIYIIWPNGTIDIGENK